MNRQMQIFSPKKQAEASLEIPGYELTCEQSCVAENLGHLILRSIGRSCQIFEALSSLGFQKVFLSRSHISPKFCKN